MWNGWGIRTLADDERAYDPMSYHCGTVWPHDGALCAAGLKAYGFDAHALTVANGLLAASEAWQGRLPELFSGLDRVDVETPIPFPTSCSPQAWAAATPFLLLRIMLGLEPDDAAGLKVDPIPGAIEDDLLLVGVRLVDRRFNIRIDDGVVAVRELRTDEAAVATRDAPVSPADRGGRWRRSASATPSPKLAVVSCTPEARTASSELATPTAIVATSNIATSFDASPIARMARPSRCRSAIAARSPVPLLHACRRQRDRTLVGDDLALAADPIAHLRDHVERRGRRADDDVTDVEVWNTCSTQRGDEIGLGRLGEQRQLTGANIHKDAAFFADGSVGHRQHLGHDVTEFLPTPTCDDDQRVTVGTCRVQGFDGLVGNLDAVEQRSVDVDRDHHLLHTPSYPVSQGFRDLNDAEVNIRPAGVSAGVRSGTADGL